MPRSKDKAPRKASNIPTDFISLIDEESFSKEALVSDITSLEKNLTALKAELEDTIQKLIVDGVSVRLRFWKS